MSELEKHYINRKGWLRAAVMGANDGILSTASIAIGVAAATTNRETIVLGAVAGIVAGAFSMAAGEFVSVSSQVDIERADLQREKEELERIPEIELQELSKIYVQRGLKESTALEVAKQLTEHDALAAHARDELGITELTQAKPLQAALASGAAFVFGGALPVLVAIFAPVNTMVYSQYVFATAFLALSGTVAAKVGGSSVLKAVFRITFWGTVAMVATAIVGSFFEG
ncbi:MAG: VIT family protein [Cryomorphaceae bacterium]|nr:VIT family protein [Cryomorphaceae bacterium]